MDCGLNEGRCFREPSLWGVSDDLIFRCRTLPVLLFSVAEAAFFTFFVLSLSHISAMPERKTLRRDIKRKKICNNSRSAFCAMENVSREEY